MRKWRIQVSMNSFVTKSLLDADNRPTSDGAALLKTARMLRSMDSAGGERALLRGRHLAVLSEDPQRASTGLLERAARRLGLAVAHLSWKVLQDDDAHAVDTARMLGRLYDVLDCEEVPPQLVSRLRQDSGVPVYEGLERWDHPVVGLLPGLVDADTRGGDQLTDDDRQYLLQAILVRALRPAFFPGYP